MASAAAITDDDIAFELHLGCHGFQHPPSLQGTEVPARHLDKEDLSSEQPGLLGTSWFALSACTAKFGDRQDHHLPTNAKRVQAFYSNLLPAPDPERSPPGHPSQVPLPQGPNLQSHVRSVQPAASVKEAAQMAVWESTAVLALVSWSDAEKVSKRCSAKDSATVLETAMVLMISSAVAAAILDHGRASNSRPSS